MPIPILLAVILVIAFLRDLVKEPEPKEPPSKTNEEVLGEAIARIISAAQEKPQKE